MACGLLREARIAELNPHVRAVIGGGNAALLERRIRAQLADSPRHVEGAAALEGAVPPSPPYYSAAQPPSPSRGGSGGILSFGLAGALAPRFRVGDWVVGMGVTGGVGHDCDPAWAAALVASLIRQPGLVSGQGFGGSAVASPPTSAKAAPSQNRSGMTNGEVSVHLGYVFADGTLAVSADVKRDLHSRTGAIAIDMESHVAAMVACDHNLPFACLRVISDTATDTLPPAFAIAMTPNGGTDIAAILLSLARDPSQFPRFISAARDGRAALASLLRGYRSLGPALLPPDIRQRAADMA